MKNYILYWIIAFLWAIIAWMMFDFQFFGMTNQNSHMWWMSGMMWNNEDNAMKEHCKMMPEMPWCEKYSQTDNNQNQKTLNTEVLTNDSETVDAKTSPIVNLKNGDSYDITVQKVRKTILGKSKIMLSYNGSIPGPMIRIPKGSEITFRVHNTVAGIETTIHPHWLRLDNTYDGVPKDQGGFQDPIKPGTTYEQKLKFPDVGLFWYHPHTRDDFEQELGEYGTFLVYDPNEKTVTDSESVLVLDDILLENGQIADYSKDVVNHTLMGRYGNTFMVNGNTDFSLDMKAWEVKRLYILNSANARPFRISIPWIQMKLVGGDNGYYQKETMITSLIIAPAERYIVDIYAEKTGDFPLTHTGVGTPITLGKIKVSESSVEKQAFVKDFQTLQTHSILTGIPDVTPFFTKTPDKSITLSMNMPWMEGMGNMSGMMHMNDSDTIEWEDTMSMMNARSTNKTITWEIVDDETQKKNMDIDWSFKKGSLVKIHIFNDPKSMHPMQHPFHMHGQRFLVLETNREKNTNLVWKDTVLIPKWDSIDILVDMSNPWVWMAHCHIVEHLLSGMMFHYTVK